MILMLVLSLIVGTLLVSLGTWLLMNSREISKSKTLRWIMFTRWMLADKYLKRKHTDKVAHFMLQLLGVIQIAIGLFLILIGVFS
jgi:hypothetical protein